LSNGRGYISGWDYCRAKHRILNTSGWSLLSRDDIPFLPKEAKEFSPDIPALKGKVVLPTYKLALEEINRWLVSIPLEQRAFDVQQYEIRKR